MNGVDPVVTAEDGSKKTFHTDLKETSSEKMLRERKFALNRLFDKTNLQPIAAAASASTVAKGKGKAAQGSSSQSKRSMLERYDAGAKMRGSSEEQEEEELSEIQLNMVCECNRVDRTSLTR